MAQLHLKPRNLLRFTKILIGQYKLNRKGHLKVIESFNHAKRFALLALVWPA